MTLGLVGIVLTLGVPSFADLVANHRLRVEVDRLFHAVHLARKESVVRRRVMTLCPSSDGLDCVPGGDWAGGWMLFVNRDRDLPPYVSIAHRASVAVVAPARSVGKSTKYSMH